MQSFPLACRALSQCLCTKKLSERSSPLRLPSLRRTGKNAGSSLRLDTVLARIQSCTWRSLLACERRCHRWEDSHSSHLGIHCCRMSLERPSGGISEALNLVETRPASRPVAAKPASCQAPSGFHGLTSDGRKGSNWQENTSMLPWAASDSADRCNLLRPVGHPTPHAMPSNYLGSILAIYYLPGVHCALDLKGNHAY